MKKPLVIIVIAIILLPFLFIFRAFLVPLLLLVGIILLKLKYPEIKGAIGERYVNRILTQLDSNYKVYYDLYVPNGKGGTTQIDHVVTSKFGIFVIETKHYDGWIFGQENQKYWTQIIYKRKEKLFNPIWQNYGHVQALKAYLGKEDTSFYSIIAFSQRSTFKFKDNFKSARVIQTPQLVNLIKEWNIPTVSQPDLYEIHRALDRLTVIDKKEKKQIKIQHVQALKQMRKETVTVEKETVKRHVCPKCGGELSTKKGKYGSFYGCSSYPKCRYTRKVS